MQEKTQPPSPVEAEQEWRLGRGKRGRKEENGRSCGCGFEGEETTGEAVNRCYQGDTLRYFWYCLRVGDRMRPSNSILGMASASIYCDAGLRFKRQLISPTEDLSLCSLTVFLHPLSNNISTALAIQLCIGNTHTVSSM